jgi:hypothetical protein
MMAQERHDRSRRDVKDTWETTGRSGEMTPLVAESRALVVPRHLAFLVNAISW